jgi:hypothetical protein
MRLFAAGGLGLALIREGMSFVIGARPESSGRKLQGTEA